MRTVNQFLAILMVTCLVPAGFRSSMEAAQSNAPRSLRVRDKVTQLGDGAEVRVTLKDEMQLRGSIEAIADSSFGLRTRLGGDARQVLYANVRLRYHDAQRLRNIVACRKHQRLANCDGTTIRTKRALVEFVKPF